MTGGIDRTTRDRNLPAVGMAAPSRPASLTAADVATALGIDPATLPSWVPGAGSDEESAN